MARKTKNSIRTPSSLSSPAEASRSGHQSAESSAFFPLQVWNELRPYAVCFVKDFLISAILYGLHLLFSGLMRLAPLEGWAGKFIANLHAAGTVMVFALFVGLLLFDVIRIYRSH